MVICLIHPHTCGYAKTAGSQITTKVKCSENETPKSHHTRVVQEIHNRFKSMFGSTGSRIALISSLLTENCQNFVRNVVLGTPAKRKNVSNI